MSEEQIPLGTEQDENAAFEAVFEAASDKVRGDDPPISEAAEDADQEKQAAIEPEPEIEKPVFAGLTESELKAKLARIDEIDKLHGETRKVFGKVGELNATLQQLREAQKQPEPTKPAFDKVRTEYGPELADALAEEFSALQPNSKEIERLKQEVTEEKQKIQMQFLAFRHPDWKSVKKQPEFATWQSTLSDDDRNEFISSWDASVVSGYLDQYKSWFNETRKKQDEAEKAERLKQEKKQRLESAVTLDGVGASPTQRATDELDAFNAVFKNRKR